MTSGRRLSDSPKPSPRDHLPCHYSIFASGCRSFRKLPKPNNVFMVTKHLLRSPCHLCNDPCGAESGHSRVANQAARRCGADAKKRTRYLTRVDPAREPQTWTAKWFQYYVFFFNINCLYFFYKFHSHHVFFCIVDKYIYIFNQIYL